MSNAKFVSSVHSVLLLFYYNYLLFNRANHVFKLHIFTKKGIFEMSRAHCHGAVSAPKSA